MRQLIKGIKETETNYVRRGLEWKCMLAFEWIMTRDA